MTGETTWDECSAAVRALGMLADPGTLRPLPGPPGSAVASATALLRGVPVVCYATDGTRDAPSGRDDHGCRAAPGVTGA